MATTRLGLAGITQAECRADVGDSRCKIPINPPLVSRDTAYSEGDFVKVITGITDTNGASSAHGLYENIIYEVTTAGTTASVQPTYDTTLDQDTTDGTAVLTAYEAWVVVVGL